jgi:hypothetical protein
MMLNDDDGDGDGDHYDSDDVNDVTMSDGRWMVLDDGDDGGGDVDDVTIIDGRWMVLDDDDDGGGAIRMSDPYGWCIMMVVVMRERMAIAWRLMMMTVASR